MAEGEPVQAGPHRLQGQLTVHAVLLLAVHAVLRHGGVQPQDGAPDGGVVLVHEELQEEEVEHGDAEDAAPERRVGPGEGAVREGEDGHDQEHGHHPQQARGHVAVPVHSLVPGEKGGNGDGEAVVHWCRCVTW